MNAIKFLKPVAMALLAGAASLAAAGPPTTCGPFLNSTPAPRFPQCPTIGQSRGCAILITINPDGSLSSEVDPTVPPYDGIEDTLVGVINKSGATVFGIRLRGNNIFGFDGDGTATYTGTYYGPTGYEGPGVSFARSSNDEGAVNFTGDGLVNQACTWFALEEAPSSIRLAARVTIDPGHGTDCAAVGQLVGTVGNVDYTTAPLGKLKEDELTVATALRLQALMQADNYEVNLTKADVASCPTFLKRGDTAKRARSNLLVSVHYDKPNFFIIPHGSLGIYNSIKPAGQRAASLTAAQVAAAYSISNRGTKVDDTLAILKPTVSPMTAFIIEVGRLSNADGDAIHRLGTGPAAQAIKLGIDRYLNR